MLTNKKMQSKNGQNKQPQMKNYFRIIDFLLLLYLCALLAHQRNEGIDPIILRVAFYILVGYALFSGIILKRIVALLRNRFVWWIAIFTLYVLSSSLWAADSTRILSLLPQFLQVLAVIFIILAVYRDRQGLEKLIVLIIIACLYCFVVVLIVTPPEKFFTARVGSDVGLNPNTLGCIMAIAYLLTLYKVSSFGKFIRLPFIALSLMLMSLGLLTGSKKAFFSIIIGTCVYLISFARGQKVIRNILIALALVALIYTIVMNNETLYSLIGYRIDSMITDLFIETDNTLTSTAVRIKLIEQAKKLFLHNPVIGYGAGNFVVYMQEINFYIIAYSHNNYWELLSTLGLIGFMTYYSMFIYIGKKLFCLVREKHMKLTSCLFALLLVRLFIDYSQVSYYNVFYSILLAIFYVHIKNEYGNNQEQ